MGFQPKFIIIFAQASGQRLALKTDQDSTYTSLWSSGGTHYQEDHIISLDADGFTVGDGTGGGLGIVVNANAVVYTYVAFY